MSADLTQRLSSLLPLRAWWPEFDRATVKADMIAGLIGAIIVFPQGIAFATIAGMPPQYGLYAAMVPAVVAALFGSSRHLVSGPTTAASIVMFSVLSTMALPASAEYVRLALTLTFMVGMIQLALGLARLGVLVDFISHAVVVGFIAGAAIHIASGQMGYFFGLALTQGLHPHEVLIEAAKHLEDVRPLVVLVGVVTIISGIVAKRHWPRLYMIVAIAVGSLVAALLNWAFGKEVTGIEMTGALPVGFPPISAPDFSFTTLKELAPAALAVTLFALTEAVSISRSLASLSGQLINGNS